jgi:hypothetical protein
MTTRLAAPVLALFLVIIAALPVGAAQQATPVAGCDVPRRSGAAIIESAGKNPASNPIPDPIPYVAPDGEPVDPETSRRVHDLVDDFVECVNRGDVLGFLSLFSDGFLQRHFGAFELTAEDLDEFEVTLSAPGDKLVIVDVRDITLMPDGRFSVLVLLEQGDDESPELTSHFILTERDGNLVVDEWQPVTLNSHETGWQPVSGPGYHGAIVPVDEVAEYVLGLNGVSTQGAWTPTKEQIAELEAELPGFLRTLSSISLDLDDRLPEYQRHYMGYVAEGHAYILVNAFCSVPGGNAESEPVIVMDGGDCFFYAVWNPTTATFVDFQANGEA